MFSGLLQLKGLKTHLIPAPVALRIISGKLEIKDGECI